MVVVWSGGGGGKGEGEAGGEGEGEGLLQPASISRCYGKGTTRLRAARALKTRKEGWSILLLKQYCLRGFTTRSGTVRDIPLFTACITTVDLLSQSLREVFVYEQERRR